MSREMLQLAEALASEKNVEAEVVFQALEFALSTAAKKKADREHMDCLLYTSPSPRDKRQSRMPSSA